MSGFLHMHKFLIPALLLSALGTALAAIAFFAPMGNTGVDGSVGAALALLGSGSALLFLILAFLPRRRGWFLTVTGLALLAAALTALAAFFLMQMLFAGTMALAALLIIALILAPQRRPA